MSERQRGDGPEELLRRTEEVASATVDHVRAQVRGRIHQRVTLGLQAVLVVGTGLAAWQGQWLAALTTAGILVVTLLPLVFGRRFAVFIPTGFEALAVVFVFGRSSSSPWTPSSA